MMKNIILFFVALIAFSCSDVKVEKPDNLIDEQKMEDILYDLALLDAMRSQNPARIQKASNAKTYIYDKHKIDSLQFAKSNRYYAADIKNYKKLYDRVGKRLLDEKAKIDKLVDKNAASKTSDDDQGVVK